MATRQPMILARAVLLISLLGMAATGFAAGDPQRGEALFAGGVRFANGGAPCVACHGVAALEGAGGASYGPDLTRLVADYGEEGVLAVLESLAFPSMEAIYADRGLTPGEQADLTAFFATTAELPAATASPVLPGLIGAGVVFLLIWLAGRRRLGGVRKPLIAAALGKGGEAR